MVSPIKKTVPENYSSDEKALKRFVRNIIRKHKFVGSFLETRYVSKLGCYKKIIKVSKDDGIFIENVTIIKHRLECFYGNSKWIGITTPDSPGAPVGLSIWVDIDEDIFGIYKFCVRDVSFSKEQICLKVEVIEPFVEKQTTTKLNTTKLSFRLFNTSESMMEDVDEPKLTWENFKNSTLFLFLFILTVITGSGQVMKYLLDYILKLLEILAPIIIAFFNTVSRMFGYLCFLIAFLWKGGNVPMSTFGDVNKTQRIYYQPAYPYERRYKALPYKEKSSVVITELKE